MAALSDARGCMARLLAKAWFCLHGSLQWRILWWLHAKFIVGVCGVILNERGEVLLLRHRFWRANSWGLPSGYATRGETLEAALKRELMEETGLRAKDVQVFRVASGYKFRLEVNLLAEVADDSSMRLAEMEVIDAKFFALDALPEGLLDNHREIIRLAMLRRSILLVTLPVN